MNVVKHFSQRMIVRASGLLPMLYSPRELGQELGVPSRTLREWIKHGMPHQRDENGLIWIHGVEFASWVNQIRKTESKIKLKCGEAYCVRCHKSVKIFDPQVSRRGKLVLTRGKCAVYWQLCRLTQLILPCSGIKRRQCCYFFLECARERSPQ